MKSILVAAMLMIITVTTFSQATIYDVKFLRAKDSIGLNGKTISGFSSDSALGNSTSLLPVQKAVKEFVLNHNNYPTSGLFNSDILTIHRSGLSDLIVPIPLSSKLSPTFDPTYYFPTYSITGTQGTDEVPNKTGIKDSFLIVSGGIGDSLLTIVSGYATTWANTRFPLVIYHKSIDKYVPYYAYAVASNKVRLSTPLRYAASSDTLKSVHDDYLGLHLTNYGARAWADGMYDLQKGYARKSNSYIFQPELNPAETPFTDVGSIVRGGFIPGTGSSIPYLAEVYLANVTAPSLGKYRYTMYQNAAGVGVQWSVNLGGKSGYMEANVGLDRIPYNSNVDTTKGFARVITTIDGVADTTLVYAYNNQIIRVPYTNATTGNIKIITGNSNVTAIVVNRIGWYVGEVTTEKFDFSGKGVIVGDSWTQFQLPQNRDFVKRLKIRIAQGGGDSSLVVNNGRSGMTSKWGTYWFNDLVVSEHPKWLIWEFFTNDQNSAAGGSGWNFSSTSPFAVGTNVAGNVSKDEWKTNLDFVRNWCIANDVRLYVVTPAYGHNLLSDLMSQTATNKYYDVKALSSNSINSETSVTAVNVVANNVNANKAEIGDTLWVGKNEVGGSGKIFSKETPSGVSSGVVIGTATEHFGGATTVIMNGPDTIAKFWNYGRATDFKYGINSKERIKIKEAEIICENYSFSPEGVYHAPNGSLFIRSGSNDSIPRLYMKTAADSDSTGWAALATDSSLFATNYRNDTGNANIRAQLPKKYATVGNNYNSGVTETTLATYNIKQGWMPATGSLIELDISGNYNGNANAKQLKIKYGGQTLMSLPSISAGGVFDARVKIYRLDANSVRYNVVYTVNGSAAYVTASENNSISFSGDNTLSVTGTATANFDITLSTSAVKTYE